ncbi:cytochrome c(L), periplasmic [Methylocella tundrae]|jgi:cytochrome c-L|uniref:cytochrome c(L), periplasmic n=1 Tax=Methylocella tundrae TaxID=227605 RepID=UPI00106C8253|nr:cytochrome c(L), periplasmic [Methylocella tundrae]WPP05946.1 cytochrome c(L), periplasmic [Methylocella tundrae]
MNVVKPTTIVGLLLTASIVTVSLRVIAETPIPPTALDFRNTVTGAPLDLSNAQPEGRDTPGVKAFFETGVDPYIDDKSCLKKGETVFLTACSGCHGEIGEGKIGPGLNDDYWTYPKNVTDQGLFETIFEGATAQMGPHSDLTLEEILQVMAWVRHLYKDDVKNAPWLNAAQKKNYTPYKLGEKFADDAPGMCADKK